MKFDLPAVTTRIGIAPAVAGAIHVPARRGRRPAVAPRTPEAP